MDNINLDLKNQNLDLSVLENLSPAEKELAFSILKEYSETGNSKKLNNLLLEDYAETPVDILTFVDDYNYLGNAWHDAEGKSKLYPYWRKELLKIFPDNLTTTVNNGIFSGSRGRGKAQPLDALLYSENGYIKMRDVQIGTNLYGSDGKLHKVLGVFPQGIKPIYKISFSDGTSTLCSDEHLWTVLDDENNQETLSLRNLKDIIKIKSLRIPLLSNPIIDISNTLNKLKNKQISEAELMFDIQALGGTYNINTKEICLPKSIAKKAKIECKEPTRYITSINYVDKQECQCIYIDAEDHLYLTNDLILTHNTEIAVLIAAYLLHRILCLKDPIAFFHLKPTEKLVFAFMNIKLALAEEIGITKFQNTIQSSPWFMQNGTIEGRTKKIWVPKKFKDQEAIDIKIGSQADDLIGLPIYYCLDGDTLIKTADGIKKIRDLENQPIQVYSINENKEEILSDICTVKQTATSSIEYQIELEDGSIIKCTPTHRFMLKDGSYKEAQYLTEEDELFEIPRYGYIYKITNKLNNKIYIGKREKPEFQEGYWGSGKHIKASIAKYGKENFSREILAWATNKYDLWELEKYYIKTLDARDPNIGYNIAEGGKNNSGPHTIKWRLAHSGPGNGRYGKEVSAETRAKISAANKGRKFSKEVIEKRSKAAKGKKKPEGFGAKISAYNKGRKKVYKSEESRLLKIQRTAEKNKGRIIYNNGEIEIRRYPDNIIPEGFIKGRLPHQRKKHPPDWINKNKGRKRSDEWKQKNE